jgi:hypothetical protein
MNTDSWRHINLFLTRLEPVGMAGAALIEDLVKIMEAIEGIREIRA